MSNMLSFTSGNRLYWTYFMFWIFFLNGTANLKIHRLLISIVTDTLKQIVCIFKIYCMYYNLVQNCFPLRKMVSGEILFATAWVPFSIIWINSISLIGDKFGGGGSDVWNVPISLCLNIHAIHVKKCDKK